MHFSLLNINPYEVPAKIFGPYLVDIFVYSDGLTDF